MIIIIRLIWNTSSSSNSNINKGTYDNNLEWNLNIVTKKVNLFFS